MSDYGIATLDRRQALFAEHFLEVDLDEVQRQFDAVPVPGLVVGMAPGPRTSPALPMFPWPEGSAGGRLLAMSGMPTAAYLGRLRRANVCGGAFRAAEARDRADELVRTYRTTTASGQPRTRVVLCGGRVRDAFYLAELGWFERTSAYGLDFAVIPHPSGRCREYNDPAAVARARDAVRWAARWEGE